MLQRNADHHTSRLLIAGTGTGKLPRADRRQATPPVRAQSTPTRSLHRIYSVALFLVLASIDNTVFAMLPTATPLITADLHVDEAALGFVLGLSLLIVAGAAVGWGYRSDQADRRMLLIVGTLGWAAPIALLGLCSTYTHLLLVFAAAGVGLGCILVVGYSLISDMVGPRRRGLVLSMWGGTQSIGAGLGPVVVGLLAPTHAWRTPFVLVAVVGAMLAVLAMFAASPRKGGADPELAHLHERGSEYQFHINRTDLGRLWQRRSNRWLVLQGLIDQMAYGAFQWLPTLLTAKLWAQGVPLALAAGIGALLFPVTQVGGVLGVLGGYLGDRLQRRSLGARALVGGVGLWVSVPAYLLFFWLPLPITTTPAQTNAWVVIADELIHNPYLWAALGAALVATAANAVNAPNWYALVTDVNLPEHRGTVFSLVSLANGVGRAVGGAATGVVLAVLPASGSGTLASPEAYARVLTVFTLCFVPAGACFVAASHTTPTDIVAVRRTLQQRVAQHEEHRPY